MCVGFLKIKQATPAASNGNPEPLDSTSTSMTATFEWNGWQAKFDCKQDGTSRSLKSFQLVPGSMSDGFDVGFFSDISNYGKEPEVEEIKPQWLKVTMNATLEASVIFPLHELWFKKREGGEVAEATKEDLREFGLGQFAERDDDGEEERDDREEESSDGEDESDDREEESDDEEDESDDDESGDQES